MSRQDSNDFRVVRAIGLLLAAASLGCDPGEETNDAEPVDRPEVQVGREPGDGEDIELDDGALSLADALDPSLWGTNDVAVLSHDGSCPLNSAYFSVQLDRPSGTLTYTATGWRGASQASASTVLLAFCAVDGTQLKSLSAANTTSNHYMVLRLGTSCPNGSTAVSRFIDTKDPSDPSLIGDGDGPSEITPTGVQLQFCLFRGHTSTMPAFPEFESGFRYGVFARDFSKTLSGGAGRIRVEPPEPSNNLASSGPTDVNRIVRDGKRFSFHLARVR